MQCSAVVALLFLDRRLLFFLRGLRRFPSPFLLTLCVCVCRNRIAQMISSLLPDILALQEIRIVDGVNQLKQLASSLGPLGYHLMYQKVQDASEV